MKSAYLYDHTMANNNTYMHEARKDCMQECADDDSYSLCMSDKIFYAPGEHENRPNPKTFSICHGNPQHIGYFNFNPPLDLKYGDMPAYPAKK